MGSRHEANFWFLFLLLDEFLDDALNLSLLVPLDLIHWPLVLQQISLAFFLVLL
jgi:hypothetical protein